jgi:nucleoside-diphosphate-sugar epimerase
VFAPEVSRRVLVTGAGGFIGRQAVRALQRRKFEVHAIARHRVPGLEPIRWHDGDLLDPSAVDSVLEQVSPTHLLHLAWCTEHGRFWNDPANKAWGPATVRLATSFANVGGRRVVMAGSCAQYDWADNALGPDGIADERTTPRKPATVYGVAKQTTGRDVEEYANRTGMSFAMGLIFVPFGPYEHPDRLVPSIARRVLGGEPAPSTAGTQVGDFLHVRDCGAAFAALTESDVTGSVNIASGRGTSVATVARTVARLAGREDLLRPGEIPTREGEPSRLVACISRLRDEVRFAPSVDLELGLREAVEWWRERTAR